MDCRSFHEFQDLGASEAGDSDMLPGHSASIVSRAAALELAGV